MGGGPKGSSMRAFGGGSFLFRRIFASSDRSKLVMEHPIRRMPYLPYPHLVVTVRAQQGIATGALLVALAIGLRGDNLDRPLDDALDLGQGIMNHALDLGKGLGGLHPVVPHAL